MSSLRGLAGQDHGDGPKGLRPRRVEKRSSRGSGKKEGSKQSVAFWPKKRKRGRLGQKEVGWNNICTVTET